MARKPANVPVTKKTAARKTRASSATRASAPNAPPVLGVVDSGSEQDLSALQSQLAQLQEKRAELERRIQASRRSGLRTFCTALIKHIKDSGHDIDDVLTVVSRRRARAAERSAGPRQRLSLKTLAYNADPSLTYVRGVMPEWMRNAMDDNGLDPRSAEDRRKFRSEHMHEVTTETTQSDQAED